MKYLSTLLCFLALAIASTPVEANNQQNAKHLCKSELRNSYRAEGFHGVTVARLKRGVFKVEGTAERRGRSDNPFVCKVKQGRIAKIRMDDWRKRGGGGHVSSGQAAGVIVGAVIGAAIVGAISKNHDHDHHEGSGSSSGSGDNWGRSYSPHDGITCYRGQRACYKDGKGYNAKWTNREFGG